MPPEQIVEMPINGRNYLDLLQLVPGITVNRQADVGSDTAVSVLGERGGNVSFLIDGLLNRDEVNGGAAAQFTQDTIQEFQVITTGYAAEFGHGSGGVVNVLTKAGTNSWHGMVGAFHRNSVLDASNIPDSDEPLLLRWDYGANLGGPIVTDKMFFFGSAERIEERRQLNFVFPPGTPDEVIDFEGQFDDPQRDRETRLFARLDQDLGPHRLTQVMNLTNSHVTDFLPLSQGTSLPSTRRDLDSRNLMLGFRDTAWFGDRNNPFLVNLKFQYRNEPSAIRPTHPEAGAQQTGLELFSSMTTGQAFRDVARIDFGAGSSPSELDQEYFVFGGDVAKTVRNHTIKTGADFIRTSVDGTEASSLFNQVFTTVDDFATFGPVNSGWYALQVQAGATPADNRIRLRNNSVGLFFQDEWRILSSLTLTAGLRWDYESEFPSKDNFSPRVGVAWNFAPNTVLRGHWGMFYDHFRLGLARDIPEFGGANLSREWNVSYPRLFYGIPTILPILFNLCLSPTLTDAQISIMGATCPFGPLPFFGVDHLNAIVAPGFPPIPPETVVTIENVQSLTGLTPQEFANAAGLAVGFPAGFFFWDTRPDAFGQLTHGFVPFEIVPVTVDPRFETPHTRGHSVSIQHQLKWGVVATAEYVHREIRNILGVRLTNLQFAARIPGNAGLLEPGTGPSPINGYGPWFRGTCDGFTLSISRRSGNRVIFTGSYTYANATDNAYYPNFDPNVQSGEGFFDLSSDSFVGIPDIVTDPVTGQTNESGSFTASNGNPVPQAGVFYNGADVDKGPSDLALSHTFFLNGLVRLPRDFEFSGIFRVQSGFRFSRRAADFAAVDVDGDDYFTLDHELGQRNNDSASNYVNLDVRVTRRFRISERLTLTALIEFFNLFNRRNPASVAVVEGGLTPAGEPLQVLPGREGQVGLKFEF
jgi:hypothetical protein